MLGTAPADAIALDGHVRLSAFTRLGTLCTSGRLAVLGTVVPLHSITCSLRMPGSGLSTASVGWCNETVRQAPTPGGTLSHLLAL